MLNSKNLEESNREDILAALSKVSMDLLDPSRVFDELNQTSPQLSFADTFYANEENLDEFDWTGIKFESSSDVEHDYEVIKSIHQEEPLNWMDFCQYIESSIANGYLWEVEPASYLLTPQVNAVRSNISRNKRHEQKQDVHKLLRQLDRLPTNGVDILCTDENIFEANYKVVNNFEMNVPLRIYSQDEEFVIKADLPNIIFNSPSADEVYFPEQLNFKSVLALLPDRINTRQLHPTFIDGQFRLELPKREEQKSKKIK